MSCAKSEGLCITQGGEDVKVEGGGEQVQAQIVNCSICLERLEKANISSANWLSCNHTFHEHCLIEWLKRSGSCPICRSIPRQAIGSAVVDVMVPGLWFREGIYVVLLCIMPCTIAFLTVAAWSEDFGKRRTMCLIAIDALLTALIVLLICLNKILSAR